jgi:hypothetical protein
VPSPLSGLKRSARSGRRCRSTKFATAKPGTRGKAVLFLDTKLPQRRIELRVDVTASVPLGARMEVAATVYLPDPARLSSPPVVMFAGPGGGYTRGYFGLHFERHANYSEADFHTAHGTIYVAYDHLGVGDSTITHCDALTVEILADSNAAMVADVLAQLKRGIASGFPPIIAPFVVGTGQFMGAGVTIVMQGRCRTFDAVAILGVSAIHTRLPQPVPSAAAHARLPCHFTRATPLQALSVPQAAAAIPDFRYAFHWEDVPPDILDLDMQGGYPVRRTAPYFGSLTLPACAVAMMSPGYFAPEAASIDVPVFIGVGERDVCPDPWREPSAYSSSNDVSVYAVPRMAHMHNFASTRALLWRRLEAWSRMVSLDRENSRSSPDAASAQE